MNINETLFSLLERGFNTQYFGYSFLTKLFFLGSIFFTLFEIAKTTPLLNDLEYATDVTVTLSVIHVYKVRVFPPKKTMAYTNREKLKGLNFCAPFFSISNGS